jgi:hypothetical protein
MVQIPRSVLPPRPVPPPRPEPQPEPQHINPLLVVVVCVSNMVYIYQNDRIALMEALQASDDPLPQDMLDLIQLLNLTEEQKRSLIRRMVAYVFREPVGHLLNELLYLQRTVEAWQFWRNPERYQADFLIIMVVTLAILATHINIDATHIIELFQPFVEHHIQADERLDPLREMLRRPTAGVNFRLMWRERIVEAFIQLSRNLSQNQVIG